MSITEALNEQFEHMDDITVDVVDGFEFMGRYGVSSSKLYNVVTQKARFLWNAAFHATQKNDFMPDTMSYLVQKRLKNYVRDTKPDLIFSVHSMFVGSVVDVMERSGLNVPLVCLEADIIDIHSSWCDSRAKAIICPTQEAYESSINLGMTPEKLVTIGFPTRAQFCNAARNGFERQFDARKPLRCLMTGGGGGAGDLEDYAIALLEQTDAELTVVCGSNKKLRERLETKFAKKYAGRTRILGFVSDMESEFERSDVAILRASPNCMFEAVTMGIPMIITGALPGQELDNPKFAESHDLGVVCEKPHDLGKIVSSLTADHCRRLREIRDAQKAYRDLDSARKVAEYVRDLANSLPKGETPVH